MAWIRIALAAGMLLLAAAVACAGPQPSITGTVTRVFDGDSMIVRAGGRDVEVRLAGIDAPEKGQPYADSARKALQGMLLGRRVRLEVLDEDKYGRKVVRAIRLPDETWVNGELVRRGHAWVYRRNAHDARLYGLEKEAKEARRGLWALPESERVPPWQWRRSHPPSRTAESRAP